MSDEVNTEKEQDANILAQVNEAIAANDMDQLESLFESLHPAEIAHCLEALPGNQREQLWPFIPAEHEGEVLLHLNDEARGAIIEKMDPEALVAATEGLDTDDLADILPEMPQNVIQELLLTMEFQDRERLRSVLAYPEDTAGELIWQATARQRGAWWRT